MTRRTFGASCLASLHAQLVLHSQQKAAAPDRKLQPFLTLPVNKFVVSEGWDYDAELPFHPDIPRHFAIDFRAPRGTPVYAAAEGVALQSFQTYYLDKLNKPGVHEWRKNRRLGFGIGHFVQIYHPNDYIFTSYCHLDKAAAAIPYTAPVEEHPGLFNPAVVYRPLDDLFPICKFVQRGELIGYIGDTGLSMGYDERPDLTRDHIKLPSWDETHLHFEVYTRNSAGRKDLRWDPYGIYGKTAEYASGKPARAGNLWILDGQGKPKSGV